MPRATTRHGTQPAARKRRGPSTPGASNLAGRRVPQFSGRLRSEQLRDHIQHLMQKMQPGEKLPSERAIAKDTGLSLLTVNKVLANLAAVGLVERRLGAGTYVSQSNGALPAQGKAEKRLRLVRFAVRDVGAILESYADHYLGRFFRGVCEAAREDGVEILPTPHHIGADGLERLPEDAFNQADVEGLIFVECNAPDYRPLWKFLAAGRRVVGMDFAAPDQGLSSVMFDNSAGMKELVLHCVKHGHRRLCFLGPANSSGQPLDERMAGFRLGLQEAGLDASAGTVLLAEPKEIRRRVGEMLRQKPSERPTVFIGFADFYLVWVVQAAQDTGAQLPRDASMAGFGGGWRSESILIPLMPSFLMKLRWAAPPTGCSRAAPRAWSSAGQDGWSSTAA